MARVLVGDVRHQNGRQFVVIGVCKGNVDAVPSVRLGMLTDDFVIRERLILSLDEVLTMERVGKCIVTPAGKGQWVARWTQGIPPSVAPHCIQVLCEMRDAASASWVQVVEAAQADDDAPVGATGPNEARAQNLMATAMRAWDRAVNEAIRGFAHWQQRARGALIEAKNFEERRCDSYHASDALTYVATLV